MTANPAHAMPNSVPRIFTFKFLNSKTSVRSRIVAIAVIPVIGFLTNGITFTAGETDVQTAFLSARHATDLTEASEGFKAGSRPCGSGFGILSRIRARKRSRPSRPAASRHRKACIPSRPRSASDERPVLSTLTKSIAAVQNNFLAVKKQQEVLGFGENEGIRGRLNRAGAGVETIIDRDLTWVADEDAGKLMISLLTLRRHEAEYRLTEAPATRRQFTEEVAHFNTLFDSVDGAPEMRQQLIEPGPRLCGHVCPIGERRGDAERADRADRQRYAEHDPDRRQDSR